ncbi:MAG TPA: YetF domain-containing protein [Eoetvoesiella sp.]
MSIQWDELFGFTISPWELIIRGSLMYWFIFVLLRLAGRRDIGSFGSADVLVLVLIADAAQNAMAAQYNSISEGMVLVGTLVGWSVIVDRVCYFVPAVNNLIEPERVCLIKDGVMLRRGMRREYITRKELMGELRLQGITDIRNVRRAYMESTGDISVLRTDD